MKVLFPKDFAALIGIDWADRKHDICEYSHTTKRYSFSIISSKPEPFTIGLVTLKNAILTNASPLVAS